MGIWLILGSLTLAFITVQATDPTVNITETEPHRKPDGVVYVQRDTDATLSCYVENLQEDTQVRWVKLVVDKDGNQGIQDISTGVAIEDNTKYSIDKPTTLTWRLRIKNVRESDAARYSCYVKTTLTNRKESVIPVVVQMRPYFDLEQISSDMAVKAGDNVQMHCYANGNPAPEIEWMRLGGQLLPIGKERHREETMNIINVKPEDRGQYRCTANNEIGSISRNINLDVTFRPIITVQQPQVYQAPGYRIELQCFVESNPFPTDDEISWIKGPMSIDTSDDRFRVNALRGAFNRLQYELIINNVQEEDYGVYMCQIRNMLGISSGKVTLIRTDTPQASVKLGRIINGSSTPYTKYGLVALICGLLALILNL